MIYKIDEIQLFVDENILSPSGDAFSKKLIDRLKNKEWEAEEFRMLNTLPKESTVLELGACIGFISCATNNIIKNKQNHLVVEANSNLIKVLEKNKGLNDSKFIIDNCIVTEKVGGSNFYVDKRSILGSSTVLDESRVHEKLYVPSKTFEDLEKQSGLKFDALICDIEGGEYELFLSEMFKRKIKELNFISVEFHWNVAGSRTKCDLIIEMIEKEGFSINTFYSTTGQKQLFASRKN